jgi:hypothetical protein
MASPRVILGKREPGGGDLTKASSVSLSWLCGGLPSKVVDILTCLPIASVNVCIPGIWLENPNE